MSDKKKNLINGIFLLTVFVLTIYSVFSGEDLSDIADTISEASPVYLLMGVGCVIFFIWAESAILHYLLAYHYPVTAKDPSVPCKYPLFKNHS